MAESSLSLSYVEFCSRVGRFLGWQSDAISSPTYWTAAQVTRIDEIVNSGYRKFLRGDVPGNPGAKHEWSFLKPMGTITTVASDYDCDLPDDYGGIMGNFQFLNTDNQRGPVEVINEGVLRSLREGDNSTTGKPQFAAIRPKTVTAGATGQRFECLLWPTPDGVYHLNYRYVSLPSKLTTAAPYPLGGEEHGETILAACLAVADEEENDNRGERMENFLELMASSIKSDQNRFSPQFYGYNGNREKRVYSPVVPAAATFNGAAY